MPPEAPGRATQYLKVRAAHDAGEIPDFNPRAMVEDRKLHKLIRRTDMVGLYAAAQAIERSGIVAHRDALAEGAAAAYSDRTGVIVGSGGGNFQNQYDYFPLLTEAKDELATFGRELPNVVNPMWLLRTLPNNVLRHIGINLPFGEQHFGTVAHRWS